MSVIVAVLCLVFHSQILGLIFGEVEPAVMKNARQYFLISAVSYPFIALYDDGASVLRAQENSRFPMMISLAANIINLVLNLLFVWILHLGVPGSAFATLLARIFSMVAVMIRLRKKDLEITLQNYFSIRPDWGEIRRILNIGIPSGIENGMFQFGKLAIQSTVSLMGTTAIAAQGMTSTFENLKRYPGYRRRGWPDDSSRRDSGGRKKRGSCLLCKKTEHHFRNCYYRLMPWHVCPGPSGHIFRRHGAGKRKAVYLHGYLDHHCKTGGMGYVLYTGIWIPGCGRCKIYHARFCAFYVVLPGNPYYRPGKSLRHGTYGSVDRYVYRLDSKRYYLYFPVQEP